jgi:hypothetical protein
MNRDTLISKREKFRNFLKHRVFLRFHMALILLGTAATGLVAAKVLCLYGVKSMFVRYPVAVLVSYVSFFGFVRLWLAYLFSSRDRMSVNRAGSGSAGNPDLADFTTGRGSSSALFSGGGGEFSGGGASGSFADGLGTGAEETSSNAFAASASTSSDHGFLGGISDKAGDALSGIDDDAGKVLIILGVLLAIVFGAGIYLIYMAPMILSEAAFNLMLAAGLKRGLTKIDQPDWEGGVLRTTIAAFAVVMTASLAAAYVCHRAYPQATKITDVVKYLLR